MISCEKELVICALSFLADILIDLFFKKAYHLVLYLFDLFLQIKICFLKVIY
jgi:hypothetical protein